MTAALLTLPELLARRPWHVAMAAFGAGLAMADLSPSADFSPSADLSPLAPVVAAALVGAALALLRAPRVGAIAAGLLVLGSMVGEARLAAMDAPAERARDGDRLRVRATLLTQPRPNAFGSSAEVKVTTGHLRGARLLLRAPRWAPLPRALEIGDELIASGRLAALEAERERAGSGSESTGSGSAGIGSRLGPRPFDFAAYLRRRGVAAELLLDRVRATGRRRQGVAGALDRMRLRAERAVVAGMAEPSGALLRGMVLGQDEAISTSVREDFRDSGLAHLLAVSGQNVMLLAALALPALMLAGAGLHTRFAVLAALIALYVPLAGAGPSLQRAGVMGLAGIAAMAASRPASRWYALLLAAAATLAWNPRAWADPGWQLSFAAVAGILTLGIPLQRALRRAADELRPPQPAPRSGPAGVELWRAAPALAAVLRQRSRRATRALALALADGVAITVAATLATAPLLAYHFGDVPLAGLPANLLALPAVAPAMWLGMLKTALGQLGGVGAPIADALGALAEPPVGYLAWLAERFADLPGGRVALPLGSPAAVLLAYALIGLTACLVRYAAKPLAPRFAESAARWRRLPRARRHAVAAAIAAALLAAGLSALGGRGPPEHLTVRFLDVGQGDATLVQHPDGTAVLFDGGPPEAAVVGMLRRAGVTRLALVVATHASRDHHGGLLEVLRRFPVATLLDGGDGTRDPAFRAVLAEAAARGVRRVRATAPLSLALASGELSVRVLSPPPRPPGPPPEDPNPRAVVAVVSAGAFDLLLSADAESEALLPLDLPDVDAMKVPHHGSSDPGLPETLERLDPELAAIEVGANTYGHPAPSTLNALDRARVPTFRTDRDGTVTVTIDGNGMRVATER